MMPTKIWKPIWWISVKNQSQFINVRNVVSHFKILLLWRNTPSWSTRTKMNLNIIQVNTPSIFKPKDMDTWISPSVSEISIIDLSILEEKTYFVLQPRHLLISYNSPNFVIREQLKVIQCIINVWSILPFASFSIQTHAAIYDKRHIVYKWEFIRKPMNGQWLLVIT